jgi:hypothetical protein
MPSLREGLQMLTVRPIRGDTSRPICRVSNNAFNKAPLDLSYAGLMLATDLDQLCKCIAEAEDLQEVSMDALDQRLFGLYLSPDVVSKFNFALSLNSNLQYLKFVWNSHFHIVFLQGRN